MHVFKFRHIIGVITVVLFAVLVWIGGNRNPKDHTTAVVPEGGTQAEVIREEVQYEVSQKEEVQLEEVQQEEVQQEKVQQEEVQQEERSKEAAEVAEEDESEETPEEEVSENVPEEETIEEPLIFTGPVHAFAEAKTMYPTTGLNIRTGPGTEFEAVGRLVFNEPAVFLGTTDNGWYQLNYSDQLCYVSGNYLSETKQEVVQQAETAVSVASGGVIIIGDSRCVQMQAATGGGGCAWICQNSMGYKWMSETAIPQADPSVGKGTKVVICLGVNDPGNVRNYADLVNAKAAEWGARGAKVYYVSVNPVWENPHVTQEQVDVFNSTMPGLLQGVTWIDTQSWMIENGYRIVDGLHYDDSTSINVFNVIMGSI